MLYCGIPHSHASISLPIDLSAIGLRMRSSQLCGICSEPNISSTPICSHYFRISVIDTAWHASLITCCCLLYIRGDPCCSQLPIANIKSSSFSSLGFSILVRNINMASSSDSEVEVLIVGAGPAGLMLALWMSRLGIKTRIVDKRTDKVFSGQADG